MRLASLLSHKLRLNCNDPVYRIQPVTVEQGVIPQLATGALHFCLK
jgi:hypothetical protein